MKKLIAMGLITVMAGSALALPLGSDITIPDNNFSGVGWYGNHEDQETEPGTVQGEVWDLEGMYFDNGSELTMVGQYDFANGVVYNNASYTSGDIFIDVDGNAIYGNAADGTGTGSGTSTTNHLGYDYVLDLDFNTMTYDVIAVDSDTRFYKVSDIDDSNPWLYRDRGNEVAGWQDVSFSYYTGLSSLDVGGLVGASHNAMVVDVGFIADGTEITVHYTYRCGNDNLMGRTLVPDVASTAALLGLAVMGLGALRRKLS